MYITNTTGIFLAITVQLECLYIFMQSIRDQKVPPLGKDQISQLFCSTIMETFLTPLKQCSHITKIFRILWKKASVIASFIIKVN